MLEQLPPCGRPRAAKCCFVVGMHPTRSRKLPLVVRGRFEVMGTAFIAVHRRVWSSLKYKALHAGIPVCQKAFSVLES